MTVNTINTTSTVKALENLTIQNNVVATAKAAKATNLFSLKRNFNVNAKVASPLAAAFAAPAAQQNQSADQAAQQIFNTLSATNEKGSKEDKEARKASANTARSIMANFDDKGALLTALAKNYGLEQIRSYFSNAPGTGHTTFFDNYISQNGALVYDNQVLVTIATMLSSNRYNEGEFIRFLHAVYDYHGPDKVGALINSEAGRNFMANLEYQISPAFYYRGICREGESRAAALIRATAIIADFTENQRLAQSKLDEIKAIVPYDVADRLQSKFDRSWVGEVIHTVVLEAILCSESDPTPDYNSRIPSYDNQYYLNNNIPSFNENYYYNGGSGHDTNVIPEFDEHYYNNGGSSNGGSNNIPDFDENEYYNGGN